LILHRSNVTPKNRDFSRDADSVLTHLFARSISVRITPALSDTNVTPMQVTMAGLAFGLLAALIASFNIWYCNLIAALLMETSHVLDCVDGELARLTGRGNSFAAAMDPITDRMKDVSLILAAYITSVDSGVFGLSIFFISVVAILTTGLWLLYMYIVDTFLNPARKLNSDQKKSNHKQIYLGLYDLFIYGSIVFWITNFFHFFLFFVLILAFLGTAIQIVRLRIALTTC